MLRLNERPDDYYSKRQLRMGTKVEMEHTTDKSIAKSIAKDHLDEFPDYYSWLLEMERSAKRYWTEVQKHGRKRR